MTLISHLTLGKSLVSWSQLLCFARVGSLGEGTELWTKTDSVLHYTIYYPQYHMHIILSAVDSPCSTVQNAQHENTSNTWVSTHLVPVVVCSTFP